MSGVWSAADYLGIVPTPPNLVLARSLANWWERPRTFACPHAKSTAWFVVAPSPSIMCASHAVERLDVETRCAYCREDVDRALDSLLVFEMPHNVTVLGRAHVECELKAKRADR